MQGQTQFSEFRRGWPIVLSSMLGIGLGLSPLPYYTIGVFAPHLAKAFGWSMSAIMGSLTVSTLMVLWAGPLVGILAIRLGVRRVAITSLILFSFAFMSLSLLSGSLMQYYLTIATIAILGAGTLPITWTRTVNHWFNVRKGLALGLSLMGTGIFGYFCKPLTAWLIASFGWRWAYVGIGALPLLIATPVALLMFSDQESQEDSTAKIALQPGGLTVRQAFLDWRFLLLLFALVPISLTLSGPVPNMETILKGGGIAPNIVPQLTGLVGLSAITGRIIGGWLLDRIWAPAVAFVILAAPALSCWILAHSSLDYNSARLSIGLIGFALGVEYDVIAFFVARYFGMRSYTALYGILYVSFSLGAGIGPMLFARAFDHQHSYNSALMTAFVVLLVSAASLLLLGRYRSFPDEIDIA